MRTEFVVQIFLNIQFHREGQLYGKLKGLASSMNVPWVRRRIELFKKTTLRSLERQSFKDFRIWILCGKDNVDITERYPWPERVEAMHDNGEKAVRELEADYLSITRLDSDDLMHSDAMASIRNGQMRSSQRECLIFRNNWEWDRPNRFIKENIRPAPPFFTHIFPKHIYKDWSKYTAQHFLQHGQAGGRLARTRELPAKRICIIKHGDNHRYLRRKIPIRIYNSQQIEEFRQNGAVFDKNRIAEIMKDFAFPKEEVLKDWS